MGVAVCMVVSVIVCMVIGVVSSVMVKLFTAIDVIVSVVGGVAMAMVNGRTANLLVEQLQQNVLLRAGQGRQRGEGGQGG